MPVRGKKIKNNGFYLKESSKKKTIKEKFKKEAKKEKRGYNKIETGVGKKIVIEERGKVCPHCNVDSSKIYNSYKIPNINVTKVYRKCKNCGKNFISTKIEK